MEYAGRVDVKATSGTASTSRQSSPGGARGHRYLRVVRTPPQRPRHHHLHCPSPPVTAPQCVAGCPVQWVRHGLHPLPPHNPHRRPETHNKHGKRSGNCFYRTAVDRGRVAGGCCKHGTTPQPTAEGIVWQGAPTASHATCSRNERLDALGSRRRRCCYCHRVDLCCHACPASHHQFRGLCDQLHSWCDCGGASYG